MRQNNFDKYTDLRKQFQIFSFEGYNFQLNGHELSVEYQFSLDNQLIFKPQTKFIFNSQPEHLNQNDIHVLLFNLGMVELISYWKAACPKRVIIKPFQLNQDQIRWWKKLWFNGLGEFFWINSIDASEEDFLKIECKSDIPFSKVDFRQFSNEVIVPVGGGKDSAVSLEFLLNTGANVRLMLVNPREAMTETVKTAGISDDLTFVIHRTIDPELLRLNTEGFLNGHTPFSSLLAFQSLVVAYVSGIADIALSNESSANEATVLGTKINHQYSKSVEFEKDFRYYVQTWISPHYNYFSLLRPLSELQIAAAFSRMTHYHEVFRSCNAGSKQNIWCGKCPKCLFTAIILLPFIGPSGITQIFGYNIFDNRELLTIFRQLTGSEKVKPFECVGTPSEINLALSYSLDRWYEHKPLPYLLDYFRHSNLMISKSETQFRNAIFQQFNPDHFLTEKLYVQLRQFIRNTEI